VNRNSFAETTADPLLEEMRALWKESDEIWDRCNEHEEFGGFVSADYEWGIELPGNPSRTETDSRAAYDELDMQPHDFDLVYAYPWPDEHGLYLDIIRNHGGKNTLFMSFDAREGVSLTRIGE